VNLLGPVSLAPHRQIHKLEPGAYATGNRPHSVVGNNEAAVNTELSLLYAHDLFKEEVVQHMVTELSEVSEAGIGTEPSLDTEVLSIMAQYVEERFAAPLNRADDDDEDFEEDFEDDDFEDDDFDDEDFDEDLDDDDFDDDDFDDDDEEFEE
jgi:hypothetical protein